MSIKSIFRIIAEVSGFNLVLSPDVSGTVNLRLLDVSWNKAFELVLDNNDLGRICSNGNTIRIVPNATLLSLQKVEPLVTEMIRINYAGLADMVENLDFLKSPRGSVTADVQTNTLILTDIPEKVAEMISVTKTLDVKTPQVMIESKIVEVTRNFAQELGIQWGVFTSRVDTSQQDQFPAIIQTRSGGIAKTGRDVRFQSPADIAADGLDPGFTVDLGIAGQPTGQFGVLLATLDLDHALDIQLEALEAQGKSRTIATPKITTLDNTEARIQSGQRFPVQMFSNNEGVKVEFANANLELKVTPHITADENIYMKIAATQNTADFKRTVLGVPSMVLCGLYQESELENRGRVPFFADIPIIGCLFKNRAESDNITELLIFVTPTIVRSESMFANK